MRTSQDRVGKKKCCVHGDVHEGVQESRDPLHWDGVLEANPAKEESHRVVIEVQETEGRLAQNDEDSIEELIELGEVEDVEPEVESALSSGNSLGIAKKTFYAVTLSDPGRSNRERKQVEGSEN